VNRRVWIAASLGLLVVAAALVVSLGGTAASGASYTTTSQSTVTASADRASNWLHVYSQTTDPDVQTGYARRRGVNGVWGPPAATGQDEGIVVDMGDFPDKKITVDFIRVFSIKTPAVFPDPAVTQITVTLSELPDPTSGEDLIVGPELTPFGQTTGAVQTVVLAANRKYQFNVGIRARKRFELGRSYYPRVVLTLTVAGISNYYRYEIPLEVTDAGGS
jgi:hypothetical protein